MKKRFSIKAFIIAMLIHLVATWWLWAQSERALAEWKRTGVEVVSVWSPLWAWILQPVMMFVSHYTRHHPPAATPDIFATGPNPTDFILPWIVFVGVCFGFLVPRLSRWRHPSSNQSLQPTAGRSDV
jgi:hypothetical protein